MSTAFLVHSVDYRGFGGIDLGRRDADEGAVTLVKGVDSEWEVPAEFVIDSPEACKRSKERSRKAGEGMKVTLIDDVPEEVEEREQRN